MGDGQLRKAVPLRLAPRGKPRTRGSLGHTGKSIFKSGDSYPSGKNFKTELIPAEMTEGLQDSREGSPETPQELTGTVLRRGWAFMVFLGLVMDFRTMVPTLKAPDAPWYSRKVSCPRLSS